jgi:hypothetical protein
MKAKKIFGIIIVLSVVAVIASTVALNSSNVEKYEMQFSDIKGVHSTEYTINLIKGPDDGQIDTPVQGISEKVLLFKEFQKKVLMMDKLILPSKE